MLTPIALNLTIAIPSRRIETMITKIWKDSANKIWESSSCSSTSTKIRK